MKPLALMLCAWYMLAPGVAVAGGWYLLVPPAGGTARPYSAWEIIRGFDSAAECEMARDRYGNDVEQRLERLLRVTRSPEAITHILTASVLATCLTADDPRLQ